MQKTSAPVGGKDWKENADVHYCSIYKTLDADEIARRCRLPFDKNTKTFSLRLVGGDFLIDWPEFEIRDGEGNVVGDESIRVLVLRYLCGGSWAERGGGQLSYHEIPWGEVYFKNFEGRCIQRIERTFGKDVRAFSAIFEKFKELNGEKIADKECGWRFEFLTGLFMSVIIWEGDDEFPSKAQILFDDNVPAAFSAEDIAVLGDIVITKLKAFGAALK
jgi:hypothetical protein